MAMTGTPLDPYTGQSRKKVIWLGVGVGVLAVLLVLGFGFGNLFLGGRKSDPILAVKGTPPASVLPQIVDKPPAITPEERVEMPQDVYDWLETPPPHRG